MSRLHRADADPGAGHSACARPPRRAGPRPDRHRQDGGLHPADAHPAGAGPRPARACRARSSSSRPASWPRRWRRTPPNTARTIKLNVALLIGGVFLRRPGRQAAARRRRADRHAGPPPRPRRARAPAALRHRDPRHRRGRPYARHGLHPGHRARLQGVRLFTRQTLFFSATMPPEIQPPRRAVPVELGAGRSVAPSSTAANITQQLVAFAKEGTSPSARRCATSSTPPTTCRTASSSATARARSRSSISPLRRHGFIRRRAAWR